MWHMYDPTCMIDGSQALCGCAIFTIDITPLPLFLHHLLALPRLFYWPSLLHDYEEVIFCLQHGWLCIGPVAYRASKSWAPYCVLSCLYEFSLSIVLAQRYRLFFIVDADTLSFCLCCQLPLEDICRTQSMLEIAVRRGQVDASVKISVLSFFPSCFHFFRSCAISIYLRTEEM